MARLRRPGVLLASIVTAFWAHGVAACTVCYGNSEAAVIQGAQQATLVMLGVTYLLLCGGGATFVILRRRARRSKNVADEGVR